ncbi:MAG: DNA polymerase III subunit gamma/tau [Thalassotalea sp.]
MSYQVLARKWRPKKFQELMGQEHVVSVLVNALSQQRLHHAYLFTGTRGVGKTTIARIFAKSLNCLTGISAEPCGVCDACIDIDQGRFVDLLEIDAASRTKVDDTREILDNVQYAPSRGRYKVYLIDEVHMLSRSSFNALLKTLEEPPEHVKFILATTDPQKLPVTVLSRCLQFHLKALTTKQIQQQLSDILSAEAVETEPTALTLLAKAARGSMRDGLSLTDQAIAQGQGSITTANVQQMLGGIDQHWPYKIIILLIKKDIQGLMTLSLEIASYAPNYSRLLAEIIQLFHQVAIAQVVKNHFDLSPEHAVLLEKFTRAIAPEDVQLYYQITLNGRKDLPYAIDEQAAFDMTLLRLAAFQPTTVANIQTEHSQTNSPELLVAEVDFSDVELVATEINQPTATSANPAPVIVQQANQMNEQTDNENARQHQTLATTQSDDEALLAEQLSDIESQAEQQGFSLPVAEVATTKVNNAAADEHIPPVAHNVITPEHNSNSGNHSVNAELPENEAQPEQVPSQADGQPALTQTPMAPTSIEEIQQPVTASPLEAILASRNMLRSKKKQLEQEEKKSDGALERQVITNPEPEIVEQPINVPEIAELHNQEYSPEVIDPAKITSANQVDKWASMIDHMALNGRLRQLAIHATISQNSSDNHLVLELNQSTKHLQSEAAHQQLEQSLSNLLQRSIAVEITVVEDTVADPYKIQTDINDKRYQYAKELIFEDKVVQHLQEYFQATIDEQSIVAK